MKIMHLDINVVKYVFAPTIWKIKIYMDIYLINYFKTYFDLISAAKHVINN